MGGYKGVYQCVGKQLALIEMRCMLARLAMGFDIELAEGQSGAEYEANLKDLFTLHCPALMVKLTPRERGD